MGIMCFMASTAGRVVRIIVGVVLILLGLTRNAAWGYLLAIIGLVPLSAGIFDFCVIAKLMGHSFSGKEVRAKCAAQGR